MLFFVRQTSRTYDENETITSIFDGEKKMINKKIVFTKPNVAEVLTEETRDDMIAVCKLIEYGRLSLSDMVEEQHSPEEAPAVYDRLLKEKSFPLVQFDWDRI